MIITFNLIGMEENRDLYPNAQSSIYPQIEGSRTTIDLITTINLIGMEEN